MLLDVQPNTLENPQTIRGRTEGRRCRWNQARCNQLLATAFARISLGQRLASTFAGLPTYEDVLAFPVACVVAKQRTGCQLQWENATD